MKSFQTQTYYELLEVSVGASAADVRAAFDRLSALYADDQVALYGLIDGARAAALRERLQQALEVLSDDDRRDAYDHSIGLPPRERKVPVPPPTQPDVPPRRARSPQPAATSSGAWSGAFSYVSASAPAAPAPAVVLTVPAPRVAPPPPTPPPLVPLPPIRQSALEPRASLPPVSPPSASPPAVRPTATPPPAPPPSEVAVAPEPAPTAAIDDTPRLADDAIVTLVPARPNREFRVEAKIKPYEVPDGVEFNGDLLRQVRMARGLSMAQVSDRTRISARHLENVEGDNYDALPATVYLRGILMNLARELGLDGLRVSKSYLAFVEAHRSKG